MTNLSVNIDRNKRTSAMITWTPPYTLMNVPILSYIVKVDVGNSLTMNVTNTNTSMMIPYCTVNREMFSNVHVTVRPVNKVGKGKITATLVTFATMELPQVTSQGILKEHA